MWDRLHRRRSNHPASSSWELRLARWDAAQASVSEPPPGDRRPLRRGASSRDPGLAPSDCLAIPAVMTHAGYGRGSFNIHARRTTAPHPMAEISGEDV
jgi:hypothetical protein